MAYTDPETGRTKHKTLWVVVFWCVMVVAAMVLQAAIPTLDVPITQIVTVAGTLSTAYVATDKGVKIADKLKGGNT
jgi:hypothetical protein